MSFRSGAGESFGAVVGDGIVDLGKRLARHPTLRALIAADGLGEAREAAAGVQGDHKLDDVTLLPPVPCPEKLWCIGINYPDRNKELTNIDRPSYPSLFCRAPGSVVGHGQPIERPRVSAQFDYEGEIALVIGKGGRRIARERALEHVFGVTLCNEGSVRDWMRHGKFNITQGKNFDRSGSLGPWLVTCDEIDLKAPIELTTRVNGEVRQHDTTDRLLFPFDYLIEYLSTFATLTPGDIIATGTPTGAGARFDPPRWLVPGDVVEVEGSGIGKLSNTVVDEA
ncbi:MAG TPA: fumarylacetoacetate hydrolase family protein [Hyphomicrobiaceae bacterium]|nr:fumarylacetoacetate hydrolase family protein [Hyphomicrobiaceae bacterium]